MTQNTTIATGDLVRVPITSILPNPYRDLELFPIVQDKVDGLIESIKDTGFWTGLRARWQSDQAIAAPLKVVDGIAIAPEGALIELMFGHHRLDAAKACGYTHIDISVVPANDTLMLKAMANENKGDWTSGSYVLLETVRQVKKTLVDQANAYETFNDYQEAGLSFFKDSSAFKRGKSTIGFKNIRKFLGETWSESDVRNANNVLEDIELGLYEQELVLNVPSVGLLGEFSTMAKTIKSTDNTWPDYFKDAQLNSIAGVVCDPAVSTTIKIMRGAKKAFKDGRDPLHYVKTGGKIKDFDLVKQIKALVYDNDESDLKIEDLPNLEGLKGYEGLDKILEDVDASIKKSEDAKAGAAAKAAAQATGEGDLAGDNTASPIDDLDAAIDKAVSETETAPATSEALGELPEMGMDELAENVPLVQLVETFQASAAVISMQMRRIIGNDVPENEAYANVVADLFDGIATLAKEYFGVDEVNSMLSEVIPAENGE